MNKDNEQREISRPLKFRVWNGAEMVYDVTVGKFGVFYVNPTNNGLDPNDSASITPFTTKYHEGTPVMQFTGLLDKNGKEIYEGDILNGRNGIKKIVEFDKKRAAFVYIEQFSEPHRVSFDQMYNKFKSVFYKDGKLPNHEVIGHIYSSEPIVK